MRWKVTLCNGATFEMVNDETRLAHVGDRLKFPFQPSVMTGAELKAAMLGNQTVRVRMPGSGGMTFPRVVQSIEEQAS